MLEKIIYPLIVASFLAGAAPVYATPPNAPNDEKEEPALVYSNPPPDQPAPGRAYYIDPEKRKKKKREELKPAYAQTPASVQPAYVQPSPEIPDEKKSRGGDWALLGGGLAAIVLGAALATTSETCVQDAGTGGQKECSPNAGAYAGYIMIAGGAGIGLVGLLGLFE